MPSNWLNQLLKDQSTEAVSLPSTTAVHASPGPTSEPNSISETTSVWDPVPEQPWSPPLAGFTLYQKALTWERSVKLALKPYQLTHLQWLVLTYLAGLAVVKHKPTVMEIARCLQLDPPTTTQVLQALTKKNLVHKLRQGNSYQVSATADGRIAALKSRSLVLGVEPQ